MIIFFYFVDFVTSPVQGIRDPVYSAGPSLFIPVGTRDISLVEKLPEHVPWYLVRTRYEYCTTCQLSTYACIHIPGMYTWYMIYSGVIYIYYTGIPGIYILLYTRYIYIILVYIYYPYLSYLVFYRAFRGVEPHRCTVFLLSKSHVAVGCCFYFFRIVRCGAMPFFIF